MYVREHFDCPEHNNSDNRVERLFIRIKGKVNKGHIVVGVCYRLSNQEERKMKYFISNWKKSHND